VLAYTFKLLFFGIPIPILTLIAAHELFWLVDALHRRRTGLLHSSVDAATTLLSLLFMIWIDILLIFGFLFVLQDKI